MGSREEIQSNLERAWIRQIGWEWQEINEERLGGILQRPVFQVFQGKSRLGLWEAQPRTMGISAEHIWDDSWEEVVETLKHEMAHQVVSEVYGERGESPHGRAFQKAVHRLGINDGQAGGISGESIELRAIVRRIRKLFALASSANPHEAEAAMAAANTLLLKHNLEEVSRMEPANYGTRRLGRSAAAIPLHWKLVGGILSRFFFVECIWVTTFDARLARTERILEVSGTLDNAQMAEYVHEFLHRAASDLWKKAREVHGGRRRREYLCGVIKGFESRLITEKEENKNNGLVWLGDIVLNDYFSAKYPKISTLRGRGVSLGSAHEAGKMAGKGLNLHRPLGSKSTFSTPKLLD